MWINNDNYRLTKHGRQQFIHYLGQMTDSEIITTAVQGHEKYEFVWRKARNGGDGYRLIEVNDKKK